MNIEYYVYINIIFPWFSLLHILITWVMIFVLNQGYHIHITSTKGYVTFQKIVAGSGRISQLVVKVLKFEINFECKNAPTWKFTVRAIKNIVNW